MFYKYLILISFLIPIFFIDLMHKLILHVTSIPLIVLGLIMAIFTASDVTILNALMSGAGTFLGMALIAWLYSKAKKIEGLGGGDIWIMTALAIFFGALYIPFIFIIASLIALLYFVLFIRNKDIAFAFGPFLVLASVFWIFGGIDLVEYLL